MARKKPNNTAGTQMAENTNFPTDEQTVDTPEESQVEQQQEEGVDQSPVVEESPTEETTDIQPEGTDENVNEEQSTQPAELEAEQGDVETQEPTTTEESSITDTPTETPEEVEGETNKTPEQPQGEPEKPSPARRKPNLRRSDKPVRERVAIDLTTIDIETLIRSKHNFELSKAEGELKDVLEFLDRYENEMSKNVIVQEQQGASLQNQLYRNYLKIFLLKPGERGVAMEYLLWKFFKNDKGAFKIVFLSRFTRNYRWDLNELRMFSMLNSIFFGIRDPETRMVQLRDYRLGTIVSKFPGDKARYTEGFLAWVQQNR